MCFSVCLRRSERFLKVWVGQVAQLRLLFRDRLVTRAGGCSGWLLVVLEVELRRARCVFLEDDDEESLLAVDDPEDEDLRVEGFLDC